MNFDGKGNMVTSFINLFDTMSEAKVYNEIVILCDKDDLVYYSTKNNRLKIVERTRLSEITVKNCTVTLTKKTLLIKLSKGMYRINPKYLSLYNKNYVNK